ncbi:hypothetical protein [Cytobacillus purgationiresistens]|uniref:Uncharacterized protein n=1 Tax=Cytobacillus purgationiresistens TaxID=863449 RepID=A0ABU0AAN1_9BACI|nr:hypothetical protein [Cytobacillus purgationiresistens]MDQ0268304.1 hypothetical protein [Cytobacillus purgationiresistens]
MKKLKVLLLILGAFLLVTLAYVYYDQSQKTKMPTDEELIKELSIDETRDGVKHIQDKVKIDDNRLFVPYISTKGDYSISLWEWDRGKWELRSWGQKGEVRIWKGKLSKPSSYYLVWNMSPKDNIGQIKVSLGKERVFYVSDQEMRYNPEIDLSTEINVENKTYGYQTISEEWVQFLTHYYQAETAINFDSLFNHVFANQFIVYTWIAKDAKGNIILPENSVFGNGSGGGESVDYIIYQSPDE